MDAFTARRSAASARTGGCPYLDRGDRRCGDRFTLERIDEAFAVCLGAHHGCEHYHRIKREDADGLEPSPAVAPPRVILTWSDDGLRRPIPATGT